MGEYDCRKCSKSFRSERALKFHMESHDEDASMAAWNERRERSRSRIRELSRDRGDSKPSEAEMEFSSRGRARGRAALRDDGVSTSANASIARLDQANDKRLCCKEAGCDRTFQTKVMLDFHMEREHGKRQADALLLNRKDIESRMYGARDRSKSRAADENEDDNNNTSSLAARRASRSAAPKYEPIETKKIECPECGQKFVSERAMNIHLSTMHEKTTKDHKCVVCAKEYTSKQALDTHMKVFHGDYDPKKGKISHVEDDDDFQCDVCGKRYSNERSLNAHRIGHAVGQEDNNRSGWRTYNAKDVYGSSDQDRAYRVKMPSARYDEPDKYAEKYRMPGTLESYAEKKAKEKEEKTETEHEDYDTFMKRLNAKREAIRNQNRIEEQKAISDRADRNAKQKEPIRK